MSNNDEALLAEVRRTNQLLEQLIRRFDSANRGGGVAAGPGGAMAGGGGGGGGGGAEIADDNDLDSQWGNPVVRKNPKDWTGESCEGLKYSDCPPAFLEMLAGLLDWQARKSDEKNELTANGKPRSSFLKKDAARARGWARRNGSKGQRPVGRPAPRPAPMEDPIPDDDVPFLGRPHPPTPSPRGAEGEGQSVTSRAEAAFFAMIRPISGTRAWAGQQAQVRSGRRGPRQAEAAAKPRQPADLSRKSRIRACIGRTAPPPLHRVERGLGG